MKENSQQPSESPAESKPDPEFIAQQLRRPSGDFASEVGQKMNQVNELLYDLTLDVMQPADEYGFNLYTTEEWEEILDQNGFSLTGTHTRMDAELDLEDNKLRLESCCIVAERRAGLDGNN